MCGLREKDEGSPCQQTPHPHPRPLGKKLFLLHQKIGEWVSITRLSIKTKRGRSGSHASYDPRLSGGF